LIPAIQGYFPNTRVQGCYFHFCQANIAMNGNKNSAKFFHR
ncbi:hypothetical protein T08_6400, partial [Trichinella sp. T8]